MGAMTKSSFLCPAEPQMERIDVPEAGPGAYTVMLALGAKSLIVLRDAHGASGDTGDTAFVYAVLSAVICDDNGSRIFVSAADMQDSFNLPITTLRRLAEHALRVAGLGAAEKN